MDYFENIPSLGNARKDISPDGEKLDSDNDISQWMMAYAKTRYPHGCTEDQLYDILNEALAQQVLDSLCDKGLMECFPPKDGEVECTYELTDLGKKVGVLLENPNFK